MMLTTDLYGHDLISTQEWDIGNLDAAIELARRLKRNRYGQPYSTILSGKTFFMFFYNPSVRTRQSFECAATELGGHAQFLEPRSMRLKTAKTAGEIIEDAAKVMSRYACGIGIRILEDRISSYGEGDDLLREFARWATVPIVSMAHDKYHPCQGLADIMGWAEWLGDGVQKPARLEVLKGKKLLMTWGHGALARSWCSVQEAIIIGSRFGMDIAIAHPEGYDLDPEVLKTVQQNCDKQESSFEITHSPEKGYEGSNVVYSRNWMSPNAYQDGEFLKQAEIDRALKLKDWVCDSVKMSKTANAIFTHPMPIDRGREVTDEVASGLRSCIYDVAENRLHVQKAIMVLTMGNL